MSDIERISFNLPALQTLETVPKLISGLPLGGVYSLGFDVSPSTEGNTTPFTDGDGIIGVVVGKFKDGSPALWAFESNIELIA